MMYDHIHLLGNNRGSLVIHQLTSLGYTQIIQTCIRKLAQPQEQSWIIIQPLGASRCYGDLSLL